MRVYLGTYVKDFETRLTRFLPLLLIPDAVKPGNDSYRALQNTESSLILQCLEQTRNHHVLPYLGIKPRTPGSRAQTTHAQTTHRR